MLKLNYGIKVSELIKILKQVKDILSKTLKRTTRISSLKLESNGIRVMNSFYTYTINQQIKNFSNPEIQQLSLILSKSYSRKEFVNFLDELVTFLKRYSSDYITFSFINQTLTVYDIVNDKFLRDFLHFCTDRENPLMVHLNLNLDHNRYLHPFWFKWSYDFMQSYGIQVTEYDTGYGNQCISLSNGLYVGFLFRYGFQLPLLKILNSDKQTFTILFKFINETIKQFFVNDVSTTVVIQHFIDSQIMEYITQLLFIYNNSRFDYTSVIMTVSQNVHMQLEPSVLFEFVSHIQSSIIKHLLKHNVNNFYVNFRVFKKQS